MRSYAFAAVLVIALQFGSSSAKADPPPVVHDTYQNLDFRGGIPSQTPSGWQLGVSNATTNLAHIVEGQSCYTGGRCAMIQSLGLEPNSSSYLNQRIDAKPYLGKRLTFRAAVRAELTGAAVARLQVHTHNQDGATIVRDDMGNHPIKSGLWTFYEVDVAIASNTRDIMFGIQVVGAGTAWADSISLTANDANYSRVDETVREVITRFADSRNAHDGKAAAATYAEDGEYINSASAAQKVKGRAALASLWGGLPGRAERRIESVEFVTRNIAVAHVAAAFDEPASTLDETFLVIRDGGGWTIRVHEAAPRLLSNRR